MTSTILRNRIWDKMIDTERMSRYYARRAESLNRKHMCLSFLTSVLIILAIACYQIDIIDKIGPVVAFVLLVAVSLFQVYLLHYAPSIDRKAASVMSLQSGKLTEQWRKLWIDHESDNGQNMGLWVEFLEDQTKHIATTIIPYDECANQQCNKEARDEIGRQFGNQEG